MKDLMSLDLLPFTEHFPLESFLKILCSVYNHSDNDLVKKFALQYEYFYGPNLY